MSTAAVRKLGRRTYSACDPAARRSAHTSVTTTGLVLAFSLLSFIVLPTVAASRFYRRGARTDDLIDEEAGVAKYTGLTPGGSG